MGLLYEFDSIAKRISKLEPLETWYGYSVLDQDSSVIKSQPPVVKIFDCIGDVGLGFMAVYLILGSHVDLDTSKIHPKSSARLQIVGFLYFSYA
jgi:hypothetical protein